MPTLSSYASFEDFFSENRRQALDSHRDTHDRFCKLFDEVTQKNQSFDFVGSKRKGSTIALYFRATKYLYTAHELALSGHTEEARTLLRSIIELMIWAYLIHENDVVYALWEECLELRVANTDEAGTVSMPKTVAITDDAGNISKRRVGHRYWVDTIIEANKPLERASEVYSFLVRNYRMLARLAHVNLFDVAVRVDQSNDKTSVYVGNEASSPRVAWTLEFTLELMQHIRLLTAQVRGMGYEPTVKKVTLVSPVGTPNPDLRKLGPNEISLLNQKTTKKILLSEYLMGLVEDPKYIRYVRANNDDEAINHYDIRIPCDDGVGYAIDRGGTGVFVPLIGIIFSIDSVQSRETKLVLPERLVLESKVEGSFPLSTL